MGARGDVSGTKKEAKLWTHPAFACCSASRIELAILELGQCSRKAGRTEKERTVEMGSESGRW